jgi:serine/threonine-protein kinase
MLTSKTPFQGLSPYDRLLKSPTPPREIDVTISPQLQEVIYRAIERQPKNRYGNARDFAFDLANLERVKVAHRPEQSTGEMAAPSRWRRVTLVLAIAGLPVVIFGLLLYIARR